MIQFRYNYDIIAIVSKSQSGKTTLIKNIILNGVPDEDVLVLDTNYEYDSYTNVYQPVRSYTSELDKFIVKSRTMKNKVMVLEDLDGFRPRKSREFYDFIIHGRHQNMGAIWVSRRVLGLQKELITNSDYLILSKSIPLEDKVYISDSFNTGDPRLGIKGFKIDWNFVESLGEYEFAILDVKNQTMTKISVKHGEKHE